MSLKKQEMELFERYRSGDDTAKYELVNSLSPIMYQQVAKFRGSGLPDVALKLEARRITDKAIDSYDPTMSQLNTHVTNSLKKLSRFVMNYQNIGHIPEPRILMIGKYQQIYDNLESDMGREPTVVELSDALQVSVAEIERLQIELRKDLSMTRQEDEDEGGFYFHAEDKDIAQPELHEAIEFVYYDADPVDKKIMEYSFGMGGVGRIPAKEIASKLRLSPNSLKKRQITIAAQVKELV